MLRSLAIFLAAGIFMLAPFSASAATATFFGPIVPPECNCDEGVSEANPAGIPSAPDWGCVLGTLQNAINFGVSIISIIITLTIAYSGILFIANPTNAEQRSQARGMILNAIIGLVIVLSSWLIIDFVMKALYNQDAAVQGVKVGPWFSIIGDEDPERKKCFQPVTPYDFTPDDENNGGGGITTGPGEDETPDTPTTPTTPAGSVTSRICTAARAYFGKSTAACNCGSSACAWAVNQVLTNANVANIGGKTVNGMESALTGGRGVVVAQSGSVCGDIVLITSQPSASGKKLNHVGICMNSGCTEVYSNSSSRNSFSWRSGPGFEPSFSNAPYRIYHVTR